MNTHHHQGNFLKLTATTIALFGMMLTGVLTIRFFVSLSNSQSALDVWLNVTAGIILTIAEITFAGMSTLLFKREKFFLR